MDDIEFKRHLTADPYSRDPEFLASLEDDPEKACAHARALGFERRLKRALSVKPPEDLMDKILFAQKTRRRRRSLQRRAMGVMALAATLVVALGVGMLVGQQTEQARFTGTLIGHLSHEPGALVANGPQVPAQLIDAALEQYQLHLTSSLGDVSYLQRCPTEHGEALHLVVRTDAGPVTVFIMPYAQFSDSYRIDENGMQGRVETMADTTVAILGASRGGNAMVASKLRQALVRA